MKLLPRKLGVQRVWRTVRCECGTVVAVLNDGRLVAHTPHQWTKEYCKLSGKSMDKLDLPIAGRVTVDANNDCIWEDL